MVLCDSVTFPIEKVFVEFEDEHLAISFVEDVKTGTANIALDEDTSINAAPKELQEEYELALVSGDEERLEGGSYRAMGRVRHSRRKPSRSRNVRY